MFTHPGPMTASVVMGPFLIAPALAGLFLMRMRVYIHARAQGNKRAGDF